jgi:alanine racemase
MSRYPGTLTIDLAALAANYDIFRKKAGKGCEVAGVIKADGYGLGMKPVAKALSQAGCKDFFVVTLEEAISLREFLATPRITVLGGLYRGAEGLYQEHNLIPAIGSLEELKRAAGHEVMLHFDTGMNRLGFGADETQILLNDKNLLGRVTVSGAMTHFACADEKNHTMNESQYEKFKAVAAHFPEARKSLSNSSGAFRDKKYHFDLLRPGMALYGLNPTPEVKNPMKPVVKLEVRVLQTRAVSKNETAGYNATYAFDKDSTVATVALGYADGFLRSLSGKGYLFWQGHPLPIRGRVSMDLTIVDLGSLPENKRPKPGDMLEVLGEHQSADDLATLAGTIGYEILTSLKSRYERVYV